MRKLVLPDKKCISCGKRMRREQYNRVSDFKAAQYCSKKCYLGNLKREKHPNWKGGIKHRPDGYLRDSATDKYIHRIVMEKKLERKLLSNEHVHHIDGDPQNNSTDNLILVSNSQHRKIENKYAPRDKKGRYKKKESRIR